MQDIQVHVRRFFTDDHGRPLRVTVGSEGQVEVHVATNFNGVADVWVPYPIDETFIPSCNNIVADPHTYHELVEAPGTDSCPLQAVNQAEQPIICSHHRHES